MYILYTTEDSGQIIGVRQIAEELVLSMSCLLSLTVCGSAGRT